MNLPIYEIFHNKLNQEVKQKGNLLDVRCFKCGKWFTPKPVDVIIKAELLKLGLNINTFMCENCKIKEG